MKRAIIILAVVILGGCAPDIWDKEGGTQAAYNQDIASCQLMAMNIPQQQAPQLPPNYSATGTYNGTYTQNGNYGTLNGTSNTNISAQPNPGQGMANLGAAIGNIVRQKQALRYCMQSKGYTLRQN